MAVHPTTIRGSVRRVVGGRSQCNGWGKWSAPLPSGMPVRAPSGWSQFCALQAGKAIRVPFSNFVYQILLASAPHTLYDLQGIPRILRGGSGEGTDSGYHYWPKTARINTAGCLAPFRTFFGWDGMVPLRTIICSVVLPGIPYGKIALI